MPRTLLKIKEKGVFDQKWQHSFALPPIKKCHLPPYFSWAGAIACCNQQNLLEVPLRHF